MPSETSALRTGVAQGTQRLFLADRVVNGGDILELCCSGGWLTGRFEWDPGDQGVGSEPSFWFSIELGGGRVSQQRLTLPEGALLRWP